MSKKISIYAGAFPADDVDPDGADLYEHEQQNVLNSRYDHGEFNYHLINAANLETISGNDISSLVDTDANGNASLEEIWDCVDLKESLRIQRTPWPGVTFGPENPQYSDLGGIGAITNLNVPPVQPAGFNLTGNIGDHPTLSWYSNTEFDLNGYKIYTKHGSTSEQLLITVDAGTTSFTDPGVVITGEKFDPLVCYRISAFDLTDNESDKTNYRCVRSDQLSKPIIYSEESDKIPEHYKLYQAYPNPFNPATNLSFDLPKDNFVNLVVYNISGEKVATLVNEQLPAGSYSAKFDGSLLPSGVYVYRINAGSFSQIKRMLLIK